MKIATLVLFTAILVQSCSFNKEYKKDLTTGIELSGDGLSCDDVTMTINGRAGKRKEFFFKERVKFYFNGIKGFKANGQTIFPTIDLLSISESKDTVLHIKNTLDGFEGWPKDSTLVLTQALPTYAPGNYETIITIRDSISNAIYTASFEYSIKPIPGIEIKTNNATCAGAAVTDDSLGLVIADNIIMSNQRVNLRIYEIKGFKTENELIFPIVKFDLIGADGNPILEKANILEEYKDSGIHVSNFEELPVYFKLTGTIEKPVDFSCEITDQKSDAKIIITGKVSVR